jgi:hypothetical protein
MVHKIRFDLLSSIGLPCPNNYNPSDFFIYTLAITDANRESGLAVVNVDMFSIIVDEIFSFNSIYSLFKRVCDQFDTSSFSDALVADLFESNDKNDNFFLNTENLSVFVFCFIRHRITKSQHFLESLSYKAGSWKQVKWLLWRSCLLKLRDRVGTQIRLITTVVSIY